MEIVLSNVSYQNRIRNFNYKFQEGKVTSIIGSSGSGKSLIGYIIMGLVSIDNGSIMVDEKTSYDKYKFLKEVGYVFQGPRDHFFCDTVYEEVSFPLKNFKYKLNKIDVQVSNALKMVGLGHEYLYKNVSSLSNGEMVRVAIASSLVLNPSVLILDEVTVYLDYKSKMELISLIKKLRDRYKKTVIVMSNDMEFVYSISDNYVLIDSGSILRTGKLEDIIIHNDYLEKCGMEEALIIKFIDMVKNKKLVNLNYTTDIDDLVRDVIGNV